MGCLQGLIEGVLMLLWWPFSLIFLLPVWGTILLISRAKGPLDREHSISYGPLIVPPEDEKMFYINLLVWIVLGFIITGVVPYLLGIDPIDLGWRVVVSIFFFGTGAMAGHESLYGRSLSG